MISYSDITGCRLDVDENRTEEKQQIKKDDKTEYVSYNPPRYTYEYDFKYIINVNNPYFDEMKFGQNSSRVDITPQAAAAAPRAGGNSAAAIIGGILNAAANAASTGHVDPHISPEYVKYEQIGADITAALTGAQTIVREEKEAANAAPKIAVCPFCGAQTTVTPDGKCEYCGIRIEQEPGRKAKKFCSDKCRTAWWKKLAKEMHDDE